MRKEGYSETTIERYVRLLKELSKRGDLRDPESIKVGLTRTGWAKMYYQSAEDIGRGLKYSQARRGWKGDLKDYVNIVENKLTTATVHTQVTRKWKTRDKKAAILKTGRWYTMKEQWNLPKIKRIFRADYKRNRTPTGRSRPDYVVEPIPNDGPYRHQMRIFSS
jgi:hypothetical protein